MNEENKQLQKALDKNKKINEITKKLENLKKKSYSSSELRNKNQLMNRLDRIQDRDLNRKISLQQEKLKEKSFLKNFLPKEDKETEDLLDMFGIKKKEKLKMNRGGFWNFVR